MRIRGGSQKRYEIRGICPGLGGTMKSMLSAALLACAAASPAFAQEPALVEPGVRLSWSFGATGHGAPPTLSLGLYPNAVGWQRLWSDLGARELASVAERPAVIELRWSRSADLRLMGLPLNAQTLGLNADGDSEGMVFLKPALIVLAVGAAGALVIGAAGDAARDNNPTVGPTPGGGGDDSGGDDNTGLEINGVGPDGIACVNGDCAIPCGSTPLQGCSDG
jgi:hypothetical protein